MFPLLNRHSLGACLAPGPAETSRCCPVKCSPAETPAPLSQLQERHSPVLPRMPALSGSCPWVADLPGGPGACGGQARAELLQAATSLLFGNGHLQSHRVPAMGSHFITPHVRRMHGEEAVRHQSCRNHLQTTEAPSWQRGKIYCGDGRKTKNSCANFTEPHYGKCLSRFPLVNVPDAVSKGG